MKRNPHLTPGALIAAGTYNACMKYWGINPGLVMGREERVKEEIVEDITEKFKHFQKKILAMGGFAVIASIIPSPYDQVCFRTDSAKLMNAKKLTREVFKEVNDKICEINESCGHSTPNVKSTLEKTGRKEKGKPYLDLRIGKFKSPQKKEPKKEEQEKMMARCCKAILHAATVHTSKPM